MPSPYELHISEGQRRYSRLDLGSISRSARASVPPSNGVTVMPVPRQYLTINLRPDQLRLVYEAMDRATLYPRKLSDPQAVEILVQRIDQFLIADNLHGSGILNLWQEA